MRKAQRAHKPFAWASNNQDFPSLCVRIRTALTSGFRGASAIIEAIWGFLVLARIWRCRLDFLQLSVIVHVY
jgi:hypothetical protein